MLHDGKITPVNALVCSDLHEECLLSWTDLQRMHVISHEFPRAVTHSTVSGNADGADGADASGTADGAADTTAASAARTLFGAFAPILVGS